MSRTENSQKKPVVLAILDGWGQRDSSEGNAIALANTPCWDRLWARQPHSLLEASGTAVGLPPGQMGNSEVGHMHLGAGRIIDQDLTRISKAIEEGEFDKNPVLLCLMDQVLQSDGRLQVMGLLSSGGVHSHEHHLKALIKLALKCGVKKVFVHAFLDGRDTKPRSAERSIALLEKNFPADRVQIASISGRYYAMDRDNNWSRVEPVYKMLTQGQGVFQAPSASKALQAAYERNETDEFVRPTLCAPATACFQTGDGVIYMNFRGDRARQLSRALVDIAFTGFNREVRPKLAVFVTLTDYADDIDAEVAFPNEKPVNVLGEWVACHGKTQLRLAETEKYAHVTFFLNGGREQPFAHEQRILVKSPKVATYDLQPEMSAFAVANHLVQAIESGTQDLIVCNFANGDMVGHTGDLKATIQAVECLDQCLASMVNAVHKVKGQALITADHGNCEYMLDERGNVCKTHTSFPVPLVYVGARQIQLKNGSLVDVAPSLLSLMELETPKEMLGKKLYSE